MKNIWPFILIFVLIGACNKKEVESKGDVYVTVLTSQSSPMELVDVYTMPQEIKGQTDEFGTVLLKGLEAGSTEVFANAGNRGSGKNVVHIVPGELAEIEIKIDPRVVDEHSPEIRIISPTNEGYYSVGDELKFEARFLDKKTNPEDIQVEWQSNVDGVLHNSSPDEYGFISFSTSTLSKGVHQIIITAENDGGFVSRAILMINNVIPTAVQLYEPEKRNGQVSLKWSQYRDSDFSRYIVFRSTRGCQEEYLQAIGEILHPQDTAYVDTEPPLDYEACYSVQVVNLDHAGKFSEMQSVENPGGQFFNFVPDDMIKHPTQPFVYLIASAVQKIIKYNYQSDEVEQEVAITGVPGFCDLRDNGYGVELYVPSTSGKVLVYSADDLSLQQSIDTELAATGVVTDGAGHVIVSVRPSPWWEQPIRTYNRSNGMYIDGKGERDDERLLKIPGKNEYMAIAAGVSPADLNHYEFDSGGKFVKRSDDAYHGTYHLNTKIFRISDDGEYLITSYQGNVFLANTQMLYQGTLDGGGLQYSDFAFAEDSKWIYAATSNRKSIQKCTYPALLRQDEIPLQAYPVKLQRDGDKLIVLIVEDNRTEKSAVRVIDISQ